MVEHNILIGTPAYNGQVHIDYVNSLESFRRAGVRYELALLGNESLITRARNEIVRQFTRNEDFTHLLFLDGDIGLEGKDLLRMLEHDKPAIGARVPLKTIREDGSLKYNTGRELARTGELSLVTCVGTAVLLLSREVIRSLVDKAEQDGRIYRINSYRHDIDQGGWSYDVFRVGTRNGQYLSEDFWVCYELRELGFGIYVDPAVRVSHTGMHRYHDAGTTAQELKPG